MRIVLFVLAAALCACGHSSEPCDEPTGGGSGAVGGGSGGENAAGGGSGSNVGGGSGTATGGGSGTATGGGSGTPPNAVTVTIQQGVDGYTSTVATALSTYGGLGTVGQYNANGLSFGDGDADWCNGTNLGDSPTYDEVLLLRFEDLPIPSNATVISASLSVFAYAGENGVFLSGKYLNVPWSPVSCAGCGGPIGWRYRTGPNDPWGALGASGEGSDLIASKSFRLPQTGSIPYGWSPSTAATATLDPSIVQTWVDGTANHGVRIVTGISGIHSSIVPPQRKGSDAFKPILVITYVP